MRVQILTRLQSISGYLLAGGAASLALGSTPSFAANGPVVFEYGVGDSTIACKDGVCPFGTAPWLRATITDTVVGAVTTGVTIKLESLLKSASEHFQSPSNSLSNPVGVAFNFTDPLPQNIDGFCTNTSPNNPSAGCQAQAPQFAVKVDDVNLPGDAFRGFDLALFLAPPPEPASEYRFDATDVITFTLEAPGLSASKFLTTNTGGPYCSAAKVGGLGGNDESSTVIGAVCGGDQQKVPAPLPILGASMAFGFSRRLRRRVRGSGDSPQVSIG